MKRKVQGSTLIELMIAISLSFLLFALIALVYLSQEKQYALQLDLRKLHENAQFALEILHTDLQNAGYLGCPRLSLDFPLHNTTSEAFSAKNKFEFYPQALVVRHRSLVADFLQVPMHHPSVLYASNALPFSVGDLLLISDCRHADLFQVAEVEKLGRVQKLRTVSPLANLYNKNAELGYFEVNHYTIEKTGRVDQRGRLLSSLYLRDRSAEKHELVEGIQDLRLSADEQIAERRGVSLAATVHQGELTATEYRFIYLRG